MYFASPRSLFSNPIFPRLCFYYITAENNQAVKINGQEVYWYEIAIAAAKRNQASPNWLWLEKGKCPARGDFIVISLEMEDVAQPAVIPDSYFLCSLSRPL